MSWEDELLQDAEGPQHGLPNDNRIKSLSSLAEEVREKDQKIEELKQKLKDTQYERDKLVQEHIPDMMHELGMEQFVLNDGTGVEIKPEVYASIPEAKREMALEWLRQNGFGDLIKRTLTLQFGMGEDERAAETAKELYEEGHNFQQKTTVLPQTLKAFVREQDRNGNLLPEELFSIHRVTVAKFKQPK